MKTSVMLRLPEIRFDAASAIYVGKRERQEDAIATDFPLGANLGFVVLADGMGGHSSGEIASKIVVTEVFSELKLQSGDEQSFEAQVTDILREAALAANECVRGHVASHPETAGMGTTLVAPVFVRDRLFWISIGDSPLLLFRDNTLRQLNEDHSMAPQIEYMVKSGMISKASGDNHPDLNSLTSVLIGREIARIDCPGTPVELADGDIVIAASDGLQFLSDDQIEGALTRNMSKSSVEIAQILLNELKDLDDPDQDNTSLSVIKVHKKAAPLALHGIQSAHAESAAKQVVRVSRPRSAFGQLLQFGRTLPSTDQNA